MHNPERGLTRTVEQVGLSLMIPVRNLGTNPHRQKQKRATYSGDPLLFGGDGDYRKDDSSRCNYTGSVFMGCTVAPIVAPCNCFKFALRV